MGDYKGQYSAEFLLLLAVAIMLITLMVLVASQQLGDVNKLREQEDAKNSIQDLSSAAKEVYAQGLGARKQVYIQLPSGYEAANSSVANRTIRMRVSGTDFAEVEDFDVHGSLPGASGGQWIWVISEGSRVRIGSTMLSFSKNSIYLIMNGNSSAGTSFSGTSIWNSSINVTQTVVWSGGNVNMSESPAGSFSLAPGGNQSFSLNFVSGQNAVGYYSGQIIFNAQDSANNTDSVSVPVTVEVPGSNNIAPPLNVTPSLWAVSLWAGNSTSATFTVCTNIYTAPSSVTFTPSTGVPGSWVGGTGALGAMVGGSCQLKIMNLTVPNGTAVGSYSGSVSVVGTGVPGAQANISLFVVVPQNSSGNSSGNLTSQCNLGSGECQVGIQDQGVPVCDCKLATVYVLNGTIHGGPDDGRPYNGTLRSNVNNAIISGTDGNDNISDGGTNGNLICANGGNDTISVSGSGNNNDIIILGPGNDVLNVADGNGNIIYGGGGTGTITVGNGNDQIDGGTGIYTINAGGGNNLIFGGQGSNPITVGSGNNVICGVAGNKVITVGSGYNTIDGGIGSSTLLGGNSKRNDCYRIQNSNANCTTHSGFYSACGAG